VTQNRVIANDHDEEYKYIQATGIFNLRGFLSAMGVYCKASISSTVCPITCAPSTPVYNQIDRVALAFLYNAHSEGLPGVSYTILNPESFDCTRTPPQALGNEDPKCNLI
jgi:hypothetical protein